MGKHVFIVAGDASGDVYGAQLISSLQKLMPDIRISGLGGDAMAATNMKFLYPLVREFSVMGFIPVILGIPKVMRFLEITLDFFDQDKPDVVVLIDYPGFNLYLATHTTARQIPSIYYVTPQIWAWAPWRIKKIKKFINKMLVIFPFEVQFYQKANIPVEYVGHPLLDKIALFKPTQTLAKDQPILALLPGSRRREITLNLPIMVLAARQLKEKFNNAKVLLALGSNRHIALVKEIIQNEEIEIVENDTYNVIHHANLALVTSGTATLETAILGTPLVVTYRLPKLHNWVYKNLPFLQCNYIALPNIISGKKIIPEHVYASNYQPFIKDCICLWQKGKEREECLEHLQNLRQKIESPGASENSAKAIVNFLEQQ